MNARFLIRLLQPLLAVLLLAGAPAGELRTLNGTLLRGLESAAKAITGQRQQSDWARAARSDPDPPTEGAEPIALAPAAQEPAAEGCVLLGAGRAGYSPAWPTHWACSSPPTGPPLA